MIQTGGNIRITASSDYANIHHIGVGTHALLR